MNRYDIALAISFFLTSSIMLLSFGTEKVLLDALLSQASGFLLALAVSIILPKSSGGGKIALKVNDVSMLIPLTGVLILSIFTGVEASFKAGLLFSNANAVALAFIGLSTFLSQFFGVFFFSLLEWLLCIFLSEEMDVRYNDLLKINSIVYLIYAIPLVMDWRTLPMQLSVAKDPIRYRAYLQGLLRLGKIVENLVISLYYIGLRLVTRLSPSKALVSSTLPNLAVGLVITLFS